MGLRIWDPIQGFRAIFHELNIPTVATAASITSHKLQTMGDDLTNLPNSIQTMGDLTNIIQTMDDLTNLPNIIQTMGDLINLRERFIENISFTLTITYVLAKLAFFLLSHMPQKCVSIFAMLGGKKEKQ